MMEEKIIGDEVQELNQEEAPKPKRKPAPKKKEVNYKAEHTKAIKEIEELKAQLETSEKKNEILFNEMQRTKKEASDLINKYRQAHNNLIASVQTAFSSYDLSTRN